MSSFGPPKLCFNVLFDCFDLKCSNSALPNSILCTLGYSIEQGWRIRNWETLFPKQPIGNKQRKKHVK